MRGRFLVRTCHADGLRVYLRYDPEQTGAGALRNLEGLHGFRVPSHQPSYAAPVVTDFWDGSEDPELFARWWSATEAGSAWEQRPLD